MGIGFGCQGNPLAIFQDMAIFEDEDIVGALDGFQVMGDDNPGAMVQQTAYSPFDQTLRDRVSREEASSKMTSPGLARKTRANASN